MRRVGALPFFFVAQPFIYKTNGNNNRPAGGKLIKLILKLNFPCKARLWLRHSVSGPIFISLIFIAQGLVAGGEEVANGVGYSHEGAGGVHGHVGGQAVAHGDGIDKS